MSEASEKAAAAATNPIVMWIGRVLIALVAFFAINKLTNVESTLESLNVKQQTQAIQMAEMNGKVDTLNTKMDSAVLYQVEDIKKRVERLEAATRVP